MGEDRISPYPWRSAKDPYRIIIAEMLLQRTRRDVVIKLYNDFISRYPTPKALAEADPEEVKNLIKPLGLAKRAQYLVNFARKYTAMRPKSFSELLKLPGVGPYIASITSIMVYGDERVAVDKNVARVIMRIYDITPENKNRPQDDHQILRIVNECMPKDNVKEYNLALLDLGWEICRPRNPLCNKCPLKNGCVYFRKTSKLT